jgi:DNA-directed RNA polymerase
MVQRQPSGRGLAYAAVSEYRPCEEYIPFDNLTSPNHQRYASAIGWNPRNLSALPRFDISSTLPLNHSLSVATRRFRIGTDGVGGPLPDIHQTLNICLQIGKFDRAATTLRGLTEIYPKDSPVLLRTHNEYLAFLVGRIVITKDQNLLKHIQRWFEVDLREKGVQPNGVTYALMVQATFQEANQKKIDRTIRRYVDLASSVGVWDDALQLIPNLLNSQELGRATSVRMP